MFLFLFMLSIFTFNLRELLILGWAYYNFQSSKPNELSSLFKSKNFNLIWSTFHYILLHNSPFSRKSELAGINSKNICFTSSFVNSQALIVTLVNSTLVIYFKDNFQRIIIIVLEARVDLTPVIAALKTFRDKQLKA